MLHIALTAQCVVTKGSEIMFSSSSERTPGEDLAGREVITPNFRVFTGLEYATAPVKEQIGTRLPIVIYNMVNIFNSAFTTLEPVQHMMQETDQAFGGWRNITPIFYLKSTELQRITASIIFKTKKRGDPLHNAETKWLDKFHKAEAAQKHPRETAVERHILEWNPLLELPNYAQLYAFVEKLILAENIQYAFCEDQYAPLLQRMLEEGIIARVNEVVDTHIQHNRKFQRAESTEVSAEDQRALRLYLAQEYSVFIALAYLDTLQLIKTAFRKFGVVLPISITETTEAQAVLTYPISASKDGLAEKSFALFLTIQQFCCNYSALLDLPPLNRPLLVVDSLIPPKADKVARTERKPAAAVDDLPGSHAGGLLDRNATESAELISRGTPSSLSRMGSVVTLFQPSIDEKILEGLEGYIEDGAYAARITYQNSVTCDVKVQPTDKPSLRKEQVLKLIKLSIEDVKHDKGEVTLVFVYNHFEWTLTTKLTELSAIASARGSRY